jgi:hypothetical protein
MLHPVRLIATLLLGSGLGTGFQLIESVSTHDAEIARIHRQCSGGFLAADNTPLEGRARAMAMLFRRERERQERGGPRVVLSGIHSPLGDVVVREVTGTYAHFEGGSLANNRTFCLQFQEISGWGYNVAGANQLVVRLTSEAQSVHSAP